MPAARTIRVVVPPALAGERLDRVLAALVEGLSRTRARVLLDIGGVFVDGRRTKVAGRAVRAGQTLEAHLGGALERATKTTGQAARARDDAGLPPHVVVHEDDDLLVVEKPPGLLSAPTAESDRGNLADLLGRRRESPTVYVVHRIDLHTSGLLCFAKTAAANRALSARFREHDVAREYVAVVAGAWPDERVRCDVPLAGRRAVTHVAVTERVGDVATRLRCTLETGRTHQIRLHAMLAGHAILGDPQHRPVTAVPPPRMALHAAVLGLVHPRTGVPHVWRSPLPDDLTAWLARLRARTATPGG